MVTRPPSWPRLAPCRASPHAVPRLRRPLIKMSVLVSIGCPAHFGEQAPRRALAAAAKYRHVTLVFSPSDGPRSDMRARKVGQQPSLPSGGWSSERGPQMAASLSRVRRRRQTRSRQAKLRSLALLLIG